MAEEEISQIQQAISGDEPMQEQSQGYQDMQPSIMETGTPSPDQSAQQGDYQSYPQGYEGYDQYSSGYGMSSDTMTEIAEQVVAERFTKIKDIIDQVIDFKASMEAKTSSLQERLKRIEDTIDRLQLSILQKVGEYVTNTEDIKRELVETQKSFKSMIDKTSSKQSQQKQPEQESPQKIQRKPVKK
jgi:hypothetical protein